MTLNRNTGNISSNLNLCENEIMDYKIQYHVSYTVRFIFDSQCTYSAKNIFQEDAH